MENIRELLINKALSAREKAYARYSKFKVGASLLTSDNKIFTGFNIENASYSLCMCGERNAIYNAYLNGYNKDSSPSVNSVAVVVNVSIDAPITNIVSLNNIFIA